MNRINWEFGTANMDEGATSGIDRFKLLVFKAALYQPKREDEEDGDENIKDEEHDDQVQDNEEELENEEDSESKYLIFEVVYHMYAPQYLPEMIMNIALKFLRSDELLRADIKVILNITAQVGGENT